MLIVIDTHYLNVYEIMNKIVKIAIVLLIISSCSNKVHVITEWDGDREIRWYSTKEKKNE